MIKHIFIQTALLLTFLHATQAQNFQLILDPLNPFQQSSLFNLTVLNSTSYSGQVLLKAKLKSKRGKILLVQESRQEITAGVSKSLRGAGVNYTTIHTDGEFSRLYQENNQHLPPLNYILCVELIALGDISLKEEECTEYFAEDFLNITTVYPPEGGEIGEQRPLFSWMNLNQQLNFTYDFRLVQLKSGQRPNAALRRNKPLVAMDGLSNQQLSYPPDALPLENEREYAWQLTVNYNGERVTQTDANTFSYKDREKYIEIPRNLSYVDITEIEMGATLYAVGEFKFKYPTDWDTELESKLYALGKKGKKEELDLAEGEFIAERGVNKFELDLQKQVYLKHLKDYQLIVRDKKTGKSYQFAIKYVNPDYIR